MATASAEVEHPPPLPRLAKSRSKAPTWGCSSQCRVRCWTGGMAGSKAPLKDAGHPGSEGQRWQNRFRNIG